MYQIPDYLAGAVVTGLCNIGDRLESENHPRWHRVACAASLIEAIRYGTVDATTFAIEASQLSKEMGDLAEEKASVSRNMEIILLHAVTILDGVRLGLARIGGISTVDAIFPPVSANHPMLEVGHA